MGELSVGLRPFWGASSPDGIAVWRFRLRQRRPARYRLDCFPKNRAVDRVERERGVCRNKRRCYRVRKDGSRVMPLQIGYPCGAQNLCQVHNLSCCQRTDRSGDQELKSHYLTVPPGRDVLRQTRSRSTQLRTDLGELLGADLGTTILGSLWTSSTIWFDYPRLAHVGPAETRPSTCRRLGAVTRRVFSINYCETYKTAVSLIMTIPLGFHQSIRKHA